MVIEENRSCRFDSAEDAFDACLDRKSFERKLEEINNVLNCDIM